MQVTCAELKVTNFLVKHNLPFAISDYLSPSLRDIFPDSQIAKLCPLAIFTKISSILEELSIPWVKCVGFGVDNTSVNVGKHNSIMSRVKQENTNCYFMGCPCHLVHNIACHASECLQKETGFDVEDICVDAFYWFDKSSKRKGTLHDFCTFCDTCYCEVVKYVSIRWLSLEHAVERILQLYASLQSYLKMIHSQDLFVYTLHLIIP